MSENNYDAMKVLVLDDEKLIRITVCARLRKAGYDTVAVETVDKAVAILRKGAVGIRLRQKGDHAELTVWDFGNPHPSMKVAAGDTGAAFTIVNNEMSCHGRGRLMVRGLSTAIQRQNLGLSTRRSFTFPGIQGKEVRNESVLRSIPERTVCRRQGLDGRDLRSLCRVCH